MNEREGQSSIPKEKARGAPGEALEWSVYYFDFEASTDGDRHLPYCVCYQSADEIEEGYWYGRNCAYKFLQTLPNYSICYAHNLS